MMLIAAAMILQSCAILKPDHERPCVTEKDVQRHDRKRMKAKVPVQQYWRLQSDGYWVHYRTEGFKQQTAYRFECKVDKTYLNKFYDSISIAQIKKH